jgi:hypothetical protein
MFKTLLKGLAEVDAYLRNTTLKKDNELIEWDHDYFFGPNHDPIRTRVYWFVRVWCGRIWEAPGNAYDYVKWFIQRGHRGWADRDTWGLHDYMSSWLPDALRHLKNTKHGIPMCVFEGLPTENNDGYTHSKETFAIAEARWDAIMDKMIAGFEASQRIQEGLYEKELGPYPGRRPDGVTKAEYKKVLDDRYQAIRACEERDMKIFEEGMALFAKHYWSLWD